VGADGVANEDIAVIGIPTEGNLVGNLTMERDPFAGSWAGEVLRQLRRVEARRDGSSPATGQACTPAPPRRLRTGAAP
jgi:hypothetical protein